MNVLYIVGANLTRNTSANMSHNAYLQGLIENGCNVDVIMESDSWGEIDSSLKLYDKAKYYEYNSVSLSDKIRKRFSNSNSKQVGADDTDKKNSIRKNKGLSTKQSIRQFTKKFFYLVFKPDALYPLDKTWIKEASAFSADKQYDLVISNSSPAASHKLADILIKKKRIHTDRWIQIWEDPWYYDLYGGHTEAEKIEEHNLLENASEVYYVSPLTLMYQKRYYSDCAEKMKCIPLPFLDFSNAAIDSITHPNSFGYFGDYYSVTRNLKPFYKALVQSGYKGYIYGDSDLSLNDTKQIEVSGRVTLDVLSKIQEKTEVLVHLSNLKGGQIPGKIYHYSATTKPILFILDGTEEEKKALLEFFGKYERYYFCDNTTEAVLDMMKKICSEKKDFMPVDQFNPKNVIQRIIDAE